MIYNDKANVLATLVVLGLILATLLSFPTWSQTVSVLGSPLRVSISQAVMVTALLAGITCAGTEAIVRSHPVARRRGGRFSFVTWTLPALTAVLGSLVLARAPTQEYRIVTIVATGLLLILVVSAEYLTLDPSDRRYAAARMALNAWAYLIALALFVWIYTTKARSLLSATAVTLSSTLLALEVLRGAGQRAGRTALYAAIAGLMTGEIVWAMNYWRADGITGGLLLLLGFYVATGLANQQLQSRLSRRVLIEYGVVALAGLLVLLAFGR